MKSLLDSRLNSIQSQELGSDLLRNMKIKKKMDKLYIGVKKLTAKEKVRLIDKKPKRQKNYRRVTMCV